eukprot:CAMPEP_0197824178 /NCGR_PEP_ID=MMETSP1437-20131217/1482_1 /TAXON_ID=49252 ORGANISM="Eucampia antarctica, Strain CCMP1452" /NCGR_SAMPLE_ID=MMETSP1437 /ASSEMBLY_ACC=CAM_ASM_001096 /LENGTH=540 /DNA_ID=CAMNT_0043423719 /DNA_START=160 /DNA_END=1779 /DNA_ORIENTATION=-
MARIICKAALAMLVLAISTSVPFGVEGAAAPFSLIDGKGIVSSGSLPSWNGKGGVVTVLTSPDTPDALNIEEADDNILVVSSPGATLTGNSSLSKGNGAAAAALVSGSIVVTGITQSDLEYGLDDTRHGHTLTQLFSSRLQKRQQQQQQQLSENLEQQKLFITIPSSDDDDDDDMKSTIRDDLEAIFDSAAAGVDTEEDTLLSLDDLYDVEIVTVTTDADMKKVMDMASEAASKSPYTGSTSVASAITDAYNKLNTVVSELSEPPPSIAAAILACDDAFARHYRVARAKFASWKARAIRGLWVEKFGLTASALLSRSVESYDRDTLPAAGLSGSTAAPYRLQMRAKLQARMQSSIRELYTEQVANLEKSSLKKFEAVLLRKWKNREDKTVGTQAFYDETAATLRTAAFNFDTIMEDLAIPSLGLTKAKASAEYNIKLNTALLSFPDSPAARLSSLQKVKTVVNKEKKPTERSVDIGLDLVAMIRPDGYGTFQGFAGYQLGGNNIICGFANDADSPDVISQFGGVRPPFVRIQPKLKVDIE